ncbi:hypothetical protein [Pseudoalteromonas luteoviolacea]|uniref:Uncharacterized protein n=1 Tax=Pseudoalteromonas luteoviolacea S4060-1 TaxID=1365257 RepID=A0A167JBK0_9GAMM|nr:hypothetical protein [Pseudoalteromonas luteoviolacea]KZN60868.1 hypothetical protein N478_26030 [Pseudoalteromonas luteoviolacea S4060-1]MBQ4880558.1 hypothetical protein [Pseudoalteromonas luteoviolacea]MBQ4909596.1 hypothetical protein [Pseudoalteromonas luteoviolacea]
MSAKESVKTVSKAMIYRAVASSTAIETGVATKEIEKKLKSSNRRFAHISLAN